MAGEGHRSSGIAPAILLLNGCDIKLPSKHLYLDFDAIQGSFFLKWAVVTGESHNQSM